MKVEIWSDVMCPFCYIGKRKFEAALQQFPHKDEVEVVWRSFQLAPEMKTEPGKNINQYLAEHKSWPLEYAKQMNDRVTVMAKEVGLNYNFDKAVVANSFQAHQLLQLAKTKGLGDAMEERLFKAYFTEGKNIADKDALIQLGNDIGLNQADVNDALGSQFYADAVKRDVETAQQIGVTGVPFFVFDSKYAVSGAQDPKVFLAGLENSFAEWTKNDPATNLQVPKDAIS